MWQSLARASRLNLLKPSIVLYDDVCQHLGWQFGWWENISVLKFSCNNYTVVCKITTVQKSKVKKLTYLRNSKTYWCNATKILFPVPEWFYTETYPFRPNRMSDQKQYNKSFRFKCFRPQDSNKFYDF